MNQLTSLIVAMTIIAQQSYAYTTTSCMKMSLMPTTTTTTTNRRDVLSKLTTATTFGIATALAPPTTARAIDDCPKGSKNCVRTTWTSPSGSSSSDAISALRDVIKSYPQEGQDNVDGGGWVVTSDDLDGSSGLATVEYKSSGKGNFAKFFNGGKPFTDDLKLEVVKGSGGGVVVEVRSSSRVGESDFGVNAKRVGYLANALSAKGWSV